jgi:hypothetical protein
VGAEPPREGARFSVREQVDGPAGLDVDQDRAVDAAAAEREVVDPEHADRPRLRGRQGHQQPQHAGPPCGHAQRGGQPRPGPAGQRRRDRAERGRQRRGPPRVGRGQAIDLLGERRALAAGRLAEEPAHGQPDHHPPGADRLIGQPPGVAAVDPGRNGPALRAPRLAALRPGPDAQQPGGHHDPLDDNPGQMGQENAQVNHTRA